MMRSVSPLQIVKVRPGFAQTIRPLRGSIVASPVLGAYDPEPDYFFHWLRDSAVVIDALRLLFEDADAGIDILGHFADFVQFSLSLQNLDGRRLSGSPGGMPLPRTFRNSSAPRKIWRRRMARRSRVKRASIQTARWTFPSGRGPKMMARRCAPSLCCIGTRPLL